ncbi:MAG: glycosyltransferase, partial [Chloroflexota bacterium]
MKVLMVTPHLPYPPRRGAAIRNYHFLRWLAERHRVTLLALSARPEVPDHLRDLCANVITVPPAPRHTADRLRDLVASPFPDLALRLRTRPFAEMLLSLLASGQFDAVQVECLETTWAWLWALERLPKNIRRPLAVFDDHNAEYLLQWRAFRADVARPRHWPAAAYSLVQAAKLRRYEAELCGTFDGLIAVSHDDARALRGLRSDLRPATIPNGVDCAQFPFVPPTTGRPAQIVFTGTMDYRPNVDAVVWFVREVLP